MAVAGKCTTTFRAEPQNNQTAKKRGSDVPHDPSDTSGSEADSDLEGEPSDDGDGSDNNNLDNETVTSEPVDHTASSTSGQPSLHPDVSSGDFGKVVQLKARRELSNREKFHLLKHPFVPCKGYSFPARIFNHRQRHFQTSWLERYNGLVYSESEDGGYCKFCVLFAKCEASVKELCILVTRPLTNFKKATDKLNEHFSSKGRKFHMASVERAEAFCAVMENRIPSIDHLLNSRRAQLVAENHLKLNSIAATIIFCGRQALALRGHRDDGPVLLSETVIGQGNFQALLQFRDAGDEVLKHHLETADRNTMYTSKEIQNEMITICDRLRENPAYGINAQVAQCAFLVPRVKNCQTSDFVISMSNNPSTNCYRWLRRLNVSFNGEISRDLQTFRTT